MSDLENSQKVSYIVFFCTLIVVLLTLIPVIFPALFSAYFGMFTQHLNPFELGYLSISLIVSNVVIFGFGIAYYRNKIPSLIHNVVEKICTFEISKSTSSVSAPLKSPASSPAVCVQEYLSISSPTPAKITSTS